MYGSCSLLISIANVCVCIVSNLSQLLYIFKYVDRQNLFFLLDQYAHKRFCWTILDTLYRERFGQKHIENVVQGFVI